MKFFVNIKELSISIFLFIYRIWQGIKAKRIRQKDRIKVLFVVSDIGLWKTENLYLEMLNHPRFTPLLLALENKKDQKSQEKVELYFTQKGYMFLRLEGSDNIQNKIAPDIIFYQQPYPGFIDDKYFMKKNLSSLICHVNYGFRSIIDPLFINMVYQLLPWQLYSENELCTSELSSIMMNKGVNLVTTGLPIMDELLTSKECLDDPWPSHPNKARIIYAPHHTVRDEDFMAMGTCTTYGDFILKMAEKYVDNTQWVFKPHPFLKERLINVWGKERADAYYRKWEDLPNAQIADGRYLELFKHSDAMIHDCGSFTLEYLYTGKPVMFLYDQRGRKSSLKINKVTREAQKVHYTGLSEEDIENFILMVISKNDPMSSFRNCFVEHYLLPPSGNTACQNIINKILNE